MLDFSRTWLPYLYLYGVGGSIFMIGIFIIIRSNSLNLDRIKHQEWYHILVFGLFYYMGIHALFTFAALGKTNISLIIGLFILGSSWHLINRLLKNQNLKN